MHKAPKRSIAAYVWYVWLIARLYGILFQVECLREPKLILVFHQPPKLKSKLFSSTKLIARSILYKINLFCKLNASFYKHNEIIVDLKKTNIKLTKQICFMEYLNKLSYPLHITYYICLANMRYFHFRKWCNLFFL